MSKRILIPTDFSQNAYNAVKYAMELYKTERCDFYILNSYYLSGYSKDNLIAPEPSEEDRKRVETRSHTNMEKLRAQMAHYNSNENHEFKFLTQFGPFYEIMRQTVEKEDIELVIMGTQGQSDNKSVILGSNAVNIMEKIRNCPVLAIPSTVIFKNPNEIVFPTSFRTNYKERELQTLLEISRLTKAPIRILHVQKGKSLGPAQRENKELLETILQNATFTHHTLYDMDLYEAVRAFVQSRESEMIALVNKKHNFFGSIFSNPMVKELGKHTNVPILAMHELKN